jgi:hypothetical protein
MNENIKMICPLQTLVLFDWFPLIIVHTDIRESQAMGEISTKDHALSFGKKWLAEEH